MTGREESDRRNNKIALSAVSRMPDYFKNFYYSMSELAPTTRKNYIYYTMQYVEYLRDELGLDVSTTDVYKNIKLSDIEIFLSTKEGNTASYIRGITYAIKRLFNYLENDELIEKNPCNKLKVVKDNKVPEIVTLTKEEIKLIMDHLDNPTGNYMEKKFRLKMRNCYKAFIALALTTGLRQSSLTEINIGDIDYINNCIKVVQKGGTYHTAYFNDEVATLLQVWERERAEMLKRAGVEIDAFFLSCRLHRLTHTNVEKMIDYATTGINKNITAHKFRATCATHIIKETNNIVIAKEVLGHKSISNTMRYIKLDEEDIRRGAEVTRNLLPF